MEIWNEKKKRHQTNCSAWGITDYLLLPSKPLTTSLTLQVTAELRHTDSITISTKTQQDILLSTRAKNLKERHEALHQFHNAAPHKYNHILECSEHYSYGSKETCNCSEAALRQICWSQENGSML